MGSSATRVQMSLLQDQHGTDSSGEKAPESHSVRQGQRNVDEDAKGVMGTEEHSSHQVVVALNRSISVRKTDPVSPLEVAEFAAAQHILKGTASPFQFAQSPIIDDRVAVSRQQRLSQLCTPQHNGLPLAYSKGRTYCGEILELKSSDETQAISDLDDFELAYSPGLLASNDGITPIGFGDMGHDQSPAPLLDLRNAQQNGSSADILRAAGPLGPPPSTPQGKDEVVEFMTLRRRGVEVCDVCKADLPYLANFCPQCGTPKDRLGATAGSTADSDTASRSGATINSVPGTPREADGFSTDGTATPSTLNRIQAANVFSIQKRQVYVRYVKILHSREPLGSGKNGIVYRAIDTRSWQQLAVKEQHIGLHSSDALASVRNELRRLGELRHPYIVEYFGCRVEISNDTPEKLTAIPSPPNLHLRDEKERTIDATSLVSTRASFGESSNHQASRPAFGAPSIRVLILMERIECGTLSSLLREFPGGMPEGAVRNYAAQLVDAVDYVHSCGLSHRDIKLENILLASDGTIRLTDFGCAVAEAAGRRSSGVSTLAGTPAYMPPESLSCIGQSSVDWALYGRSQDIWAIGCVVHHLLTGEAPWKSVSVTNPFALLVYSQTHDFPLQVDRLSTAALNFCMQCFRRSPVDRVTASELLNDPFLNQDAESSHTS